MKHVDAFLVGLVLLTPNTLSAATLTVPDDHATIEAAIDAAVYGDEIVVSCGTYYEHHLVLESGLVLRSETGLPECVIIDAQGQDYVMYIPQGDETTLVEGITFTGGHSGTGGGLICGYPTRATIRRCDIVGNSASFNGGGLVCMGASPVFEECRILNNVAQDSDYGGGGVYLNTASPVFRDCVFSGNTAGDEIGGAITIYASEPEFVNCLFQNNIARLGSAFFANNSAVTFTGCTFEQNTGVGIGAAYVYEATVSLTACELRDNSTENGYGGGIRGLSNAIIKMDFCVVENNSAFQGGGVYLNFTSNLTATGCRILGNTASSEGPDGYVAADSEALLICCEIDPAAWSGDGSINVVEDGCVIQTEQSTWGRIKAMYR